MKSFYLTVFNFKQEPVGNPLRGHVQPGAGLAFVTAFNDFLTASPNAVMKRCTFYSEADTGLDYELRIEMQVSVEGLQVFGPTFIDHMRPLTADGRVRLDL